MITGNDEKPGRLRVRDAKLVIPIIQKMPLGEAAEAQAAAEKCGIEKILLVA
jgi:hypothetical protein